MTYSSRRCGGHPDDRLPFVAGTKRTMSLSSLLFALTIFTTSCSFGTSQATTTTTAATRVRKEEDRSTRRLSYDLIAGFEPRTDVSDHLRIDLDQAQIMDYLELESETSFQNAQNVYNKGAYSKSIATIDLDSGTPIDKDVDLGTNVFGYNIAGREIRLYSYKNLRPGDSKIELVYTQPGCHVGGLVGPQNIVSPLDLTDSGDQIWDGCLKEQGNITIDGRNYQYTYSIPLNNWNGRSIAQFSTAASIRMRPDEDLQPYIKDFQKYVDYYGMPDYANEWIVSAIEGTKTNFQRGNADFSIWEKDFYARGNAIHKGTAYMSIFMYVIRELEDAVYDCEHFCIYEICNDDMAHALDEAVAFYTGSLEGEDGNGDGYLLYHLANERAANFRTAGRLASTFEAQGTAKVNYDIFEQFEIMQDRLARGDCTGARKNKERIVQLMYIPIVQSVLRYAYINAFDPDAGPKSKAEGATFAAALLPVVADCDDQDADILYNNMRTNSGEVNFAQVKESLEKNYECMGITCENVGGIWNDALGVYEDAAGPCEDVMVYPSGASSVPLAAGVGAAVGIVVLIAVITALCIWSRKKEKPAQGIDVMPDENAVAA